MKVRMEMAMTFLSAAALGLVMCLHGPTLPKYWLFDLGVPWFFFASGVWYVRTSSGVRRRPGVGYAQQVKKRVRSLLVPYFLWNLIWFPILFACNWVGWRYCGAQRVVDGSLPCVLRCLGLSLFAWPALVPTWFLRALFVAVVLVGGVRNLEVRKSGGLKAPILTIDLLLAVALWAIYWTRGWWMPSGDLWEGFFTFGIPLLGCACFATGCAVEAYLEVLKFERLDSTADLRPAPACVGMFRRQMMPVYVLHAAVIVAVGWVAKAFGLFGCLATVAGDVVMWFVGIAGSIAVGEMLRRFAPRAAKVLFGGR